MPLAAAPTLIPGGGFLGAVIIRLSL